VVCVCVCSVNLSTLVATDRHTLVYIIIYIVLLYTCSVLCNTNTSDTAEIPPVVVCTLRTSACQRVSCLSVYYYYYYYYYYTVLICFLFFFLAADDHTGAGAADLIFFLRVLRLYPLQCAILSRHIKCIPIIGKMPSGMTTSSVRARYL